SGSLIKYEEENTSETCSNCGDLKQDLGGNTVYTYEPYGEDLDKDVNKSFSKRRTQSVMPSSRENLSALLAL
ncbi:hypothetical protein BBP00_00007268, partial [Phytophthora kernoviae]